VNMDSDVSSISMSIDNGLLAQLRLEEAAGVWAGGCVRDGFESTLVGSCCIEELPAYTVTLIRNFLDSPQVAATSSAAPRRTTLAKSVSLPPSMSSRSMVIPDRQFWSWRDSDCGAQR